MSAGQGINVGGLAQTVMTGVVNHFAQSEVSLPDRRIISPGSPREVAWDCDSVIVTCQGVLWGPATGLGGSAARQTGNPLSTVTRHSLIVVQIVRCVPEHDGNHLPHQDEVTEAGLGLMRDAGLLSQALLELCGPGGALKAAGAAVAGAVETIGPGGGLAAVEGNASVTVGTLT